MLPATTDHDHFLGTWLRPHRLILYVRINFYAQSAAASLRPHYPGPVLKHAHPPNPTISYWQRLPSPPQSKWHQQYINIHRYICKNKFRLRLKPLSCCGVGECFASFYKRGNSKSTRTHTRPTGRHEGRCWE